MLDPREVTLIAGALKSVSAVFAIAKIDPTVDQLPGVATLRISSGACSVLLHHALVSGLIDKEELLDAMEGQGMARDHAFNYISFIIENPPVTVMREKVKTAAGANDGA